MSHFAGLVILTPDYLKKHDLEMSLDKYCEHREVPEYSKGPLSDYEKLDFIHYYKYKDGTIAFSHDKKDLWEMMYNKFLEEGKVEPFDEKRDRSIYLLLRHTLGEEEFQKAYVELFNSLYPGLLDDFDKLYRELGKDWNSDTWRFNYVSGQWEEYSTYNPDSKWDWYEEGNRWDKTIKTKNGELVNRCKLGDIDWSDFKPEDYVKKAVKDEWTGEMYHPLKKNVQWHFTKSSIPFCLVVDGQWFEKGEMGWFGASFNDKDPQDWNNEFFEILSRLPENSRVHLIDFHI